MNYCDYAEWRAWRNDYYDQLRLEQRNVSRMISYAPQTANRKGMWIGEVNAAAQYYYTVVVPASERLSREFCGELAEKIMREAPAL